MRADQAQQNCCYSLIMHGLKDLDETVSEGGKVRVLVEIETASIFRLDILGRVGGQKPTGRTWTHRTEPKSGQNPTDLFFFLCRHSCLLHLGIPLIISPHSSIAICFSVMFNITQDDSVCLFVSCSASHEMAELASLSHNQSHSTIRQCLSL